MVWLRRPAPPGLDRWGPEMSLTHDELDPDGGGIRPMELLRPVPIGELPPSAQRGHAAAPAVRHWPVYDPYTARRRQSPEWLVRYTPRLVVFDVVAVLLAGAFAVGLP